MNNTTAAANIVRSEAGRVEIAPRAIATIVAATVMQTYGVVGMAPRNLRDSVIHVLRPEEQHKGIEVRCSAQSIVIDLYVIVEYGTRIATVARNIMQNVSYAVEQALGQPVTEVNVHVQGLRNAESRQLGQHSGG